MTYTAKHGSTREVAGPVSKILRAQGVRVDLRPACGVRGPIGDRDLVVPGAPIYSRRWHRDARRFLKRHRKELLTVPVAVSGGADPPARQGRRRRDLRDWDAVRAWAAGIGHDQAQPPPGAGAAAGS